MRTITALVLYVSLAYADDTTSIGRNWDSLSKQGIAAIARADYPAAETLFRDSLKLARTPQQISIATGNVAVVLHQSGRDQEATQWLERAYQASKDPSVAAQLAVLYRFAGDYGHAEQLARETLAGATADPEARANLLNIVADILREEARDSEARNLFDEARHVQGASWRCQVESIIGLAGIDRDIDKWKNALELARAHHDNSMEAIALRGEAESWMSLKNPARAEPALRHSIALFETSEEPSGHQMASTLGILAQLYIDEDKAAMAEDALLRALSMEEKALGADHPQIAMLLQMLGDTSARLNRMDQSRRYFDRAALIMGSRFGESSSIEGSVYANLGTVEQRSNHPAEAVRAYQKAMAIMDFSRPELAGLRVSIAERYAGALKATHHDQEAKVLLAQVKGFRGK